MLNELYKYACDRDVIAPPGFKKRKLKAYVNLTSQGELIGIMISSNEAILLPDIGAAALGTEACNIIAEKISIIFELPEKDGSIKAGTTRKHQFFISALEECVPISQAFAVCAGVLNDTEKREKILEALVEQKVKPGDIIGFKVDGVSLEKTSGFTEWWNTFRMKYQKSSGGEARCMITGEMASPMVTVPKVSGLMSVGGHTANDALICFDKDAFCSYELRQAMNATVSEVAMSAINSSLEQLIKEAPILAGAKFIHWYQKPLEEPGNDVFSTLFEKKGSDADEDDETEGDRENEDKADLRAKAAAAERGANDVVTSPKTGEKIVKLSNRYYILTLSGAGGRIMVRGFMQGSYEDLCTNISIWQADLQMKDCFGGCYEKSLSQLYYRLLKPTGSGKSLNERMASELAGLDTQFLYSIVNNTPLPDSVAVKALRYIRSKMLDNGSGKDQQNSKSTKAVCPDMTACRLLKAWLNRKYRLNNMEERKMTPELYENYPGQAYQLGRLMAVYAKIQEDALGRVGAGVVERYYASACTKPALVFGSLSRLVGHHLSKLEPGKSVYYKKILQSVSTHITPNIPVTFTLPEQAEFSIGYFQQNASMYSK